MPPTLTSRLVAATAGLAMLTASLARASDDGFIPLFNGRDLSGWTVVIDDAGQREGQAIFQVRDGVIHVYADATDGSRQPFAGLMTEKAYSNYHLRLQFKWGTRKFAPRTNAVRDAGVLFHLHGNPVIWPPSVECQIQEGDCGDLWIIGETRASTPIHQLSNGYDANGDIRTLGAGMRDGIRAPRGASWETPGWNTVELIVSGSHATFRINGKVVNEARHMRWRAPGGNDWQWQPLVEGRIFLQAEGAEVFYRQIEIRPLEPATKPGAG